MCIRDSPTPTIFSLWSSYNEVNTRVYGVTSDIIHEINESCSTVVKQLQDDVSEIRKRRESRESELEQVGDFKSENNNNYNELSVD